MITAEEPLWAGEVWAVYPPRDFSMGTNSVSDKGVSLKVNWTERAIPKMGPFVADIKTFLRMFDDYVGKGRVEDAEAVKVFGPFGLFDGTGHFTVPVITAKRGDPLYDLSDRSRKRSPRPCRASSTSVLCASNSASVTATGAGDCVP